MLVKPKLLWKFSGCISYLPLINSISFFSHGVFHGITHSPKTSHQESPPQQPYSSHPQGLSSVQKYQKICLLIFSELGISYIIQNLVCDEFYNLNYLPFRSLVISSTKLMGLLGMGYGSSHNGLASEAVTDKLKIVNMTNFMF